MYNVSSAYKSAAAGAIQEHKLTGTIGSISFTEANIVSGSFSIQNQCSSGAGSDIQPGSVIIGELSAVFTGINLTRGQWRNKVITPTFSLKVGNTWEAVPLGVFKVKEAKHTANGVEVKAYDNMHKFDKSFKKKRFKYSGTMYQFLSDMCTRCHVTLGMLQSEVELLTNGTQSRKIYGLYKDEAANDIKTFRDFLSYIAQATCTFATINRAGALVLRPFGGGTAVDTISDSMRLSGAVFEDYETKYNGIFVNDMDTGDEVYYGYDADDCADMLTNLTAELQDNVTAHNNLENEHDAGKISDSDYAQQKLVLDKEATRIQYRMGEVTDWNTYRTEHPEVAEGSSIILGDNPLLQSDNITYRDVDRTNILAAAMEVAYTPFTCSLVCGAHYDLGDVIEFTNGHAGTSTMCCVMGWEYNLNAENNLEGYGADPDIANVHSLARKKASTTLKDYNDTKVEVTNIYNAKNGTEIAQISVNGVPKSIYERKANFTGQDPIDNIGDIDDLAEKGDLYIQTETIKIEKYTVDRNSKQYFGIIKGISNYYPSVELKQMAFQWSKTGYNINFSQTSDAVAGEYMSGHYGEPIYKVTGINKVGSYKFHCKIAYTADAENSNAAGHFIGLGFFNPNIDGSWTAPGGTWTPGTFNTTPNGGILNCSAEKGTFNEYTGTFTVTQDWVNRGFFYLWILATRFQYVQNGPHIGNGTITIRELTIYHEDDVQDDTDISSIYVNVDKTSQSNSQQTRGATRAAGDSENTTEWKEISFIKGAGDGLHLDDYKKVNLDSDVMRAWIKADPPQQEQLYNRYCIRYTGDPDNSVTISYFNAVGWSNLQAVKPDKEGVYSFKCGGTVDTSTVQYVAYKITGLTSGVRYYFNFKAGFNTSSFGDDYTKGLGVVFNTTGSINTNSWTGDPHTFNETTLYESFYRSSGGHFYDFSFIATASTMYMIVTVGDITNGTTAQLSMSYFVVSKTEKKYARSIYLYDTEDDVWIRYKPFGSGSGDGEGSISTLGELDDVDLDNVADGDALVYDAELGEWVNGDAGVSDYPDLTNKPQINSVTLSGNKTTRDLQIFEKKHLSEFEQLSTTEKNNPDKFFFVDDKGGSGGGGGGGGSSTLAGLTDVSLSSPADGQILEYDATNQVWKNANPSGGTTVIANPSGTATETLSKIQIGSTIYGISGGSGGGFTETLINSADITATGDVTVSDFSDADMLHFVVGVNTGIYEVFDSYITVADFKLGWKHFIGGTIRNTSVWSAYASVTYVNDTTITVVGINGAQWTNTKTIYKIYKIKF